MFEKLVARGFHLFPVLPMGKLPALPAFENIATRNLGQIKMWQEDPVMGIANGMNMGIATGRWHEGYLLAVDVDNKDDVRGDEQILMLEFEGKVLPPTFEQRTPTGGRHLIYWTERPFSNTASKIARGIDTRGKGGFVVAAGSEVEAGKYEIAHDREVARAPDWLTAMLEEAKERAPDEPVDVDQDLALERAKEYLKTAPLAVEGASGDATTFAVCARLKDFGLEKDAALELLLDEWNENCSPPWEPEDLLEKLNNAYRYGKLPVGGDAPEKDFEEIKLKENEACDEHFLARMNKNFALYFGGSEFSIIQKYKTAEGTIDTRTISERTFLRMFSNQKVMTGKGKFRTPAEMWMEWPGRREYQGMVFRPMQDAPPGYLNTWAGFAVTGAGAVGERASRGFEAWKEHLLKGICDGDELAAKWLTGWFAHLVQRPFERPLTTVVFKGRKGTGKNALLDRLGKIIGRKYYKTAHSSRYLTGQFNSHMEDCLMLVLDEAFWSGDKAGDSALKGLTTAPEIFIEKKGVDPVVQKNLVRIVIVGNEEWLVPASMDERRYAVFNVNEWRMQDTEFFRQMREDLDEHGGAELLMQYLLDFDLSSVDINVAPKTQGLVEQKLLTLTPVHEWLRDCLQEGSFIGESAEVPWLEEIPTTRVFAAVSKYCRDRSIRTRIPNATHLGRSLRAAIPGVKNTRASNGDRMRVYKMPPLAEARAQFEKTIGGKIAWDSA